ncbi:MAG: RNA polymerase sigma-54 factor [Burkholderiales bacterium PBB1]|nr:MAG: RNA polymerase sigma-54 factor [Burkholderiales bacterium PBB1]
MSSLSFRAEPRSVQALSPRFQHAVRLLQLSSVDFAATVRDVLGHNPFLELEEDAADGEQHDADSVDLVSDDNAASPDDRLDTLYADPTMSADRSDDRDQWPMDGTVSPRPTGEGDCSALDLLAVETPLNAHLRAQLDLQPLATRERWIALVIVESLDDDGYLRTPLTELGELCGLTPDVRLAEIDAALQRVQALDPAGVGACSVADCLRLQLPAIECPELRALAACIVAEHLPLLAARDVPALARALGESVLRIQEVCDRIRRFDPRPGWRFSAARIAYVVPDVVAKKVRGEWRVQLNPVVIPRVRLNQVYADLFKRHRNAAHVDMADQLQEARWTVKNLEQRFSTILDVAEAIVKRQRHFLEFGPMAMKPLGLKEIADELGIHESTVSRVTNNKYMATPSGVFELKYFFSRVMVTASGSACSGTAIRGLLKDLIGAEAPQAPLSDAEITRQLAQQGLVVARRTVTKYRQSLRIDAVERRRRQA